MQITYPFNRITLIVLDGAGIGAMPDAPEWGDAGSDTFGHILESRPVHLPNLQSIGLGNRRARQGVPPADEPRGSYGKCTLRANGKDTTTGFGKQYAAARGLQKLLALVASLINTNDELVGNAVADSVTTLPLR
jgi:phosphopentomutase